MAIELTDKKDWLEKPDKYISAFRERYKALAEKDRPAFFEKIEKRLRDWSGPALDAHILRLNPNNAWAVVIHLFTGKRALAHKVHIKAALPNYIETAIIKWKNLKDKPGKQAAWKKEVVEAVGAFAPDNWMKKVSEPVAKKFVSTFFGDEIKAAADTAKAGTSGGKIAAVLFLGALVLVAVKLGKKGAKNAA